MSDSANSSASICDIAGCTTPATASRWISIGEGEKRHLEVCWKHEDGDLTERELDALSR